jgi:hypothetical protein
MVRFVRLKKSGGFEILNTLRQKITIHGLT